MVSHPEVRKRLQQFVCVRFDWEQMQKHKDRLETPTQGNQILLAPNGQYIPGIVPKGKRYDVSTFVELLDRVLEQHSPKPESADLLKLDWFFWNPEKYGLPPVFGCEMLSRLDRKPLLKVSGPIPDWLDDTRFLRSHQRQFIWTRGDESGPARITVRQLEPQERDLAAVELDDVSPDELGRTLDRAWLDYMKVRPMVARGYIDNEHGNWLKTVMEKIHQEELALREAALQETLAPPGRARPGE